MEKCLKRFLLIISALFLIYQVYNFFWQLNYEKKIEQVIITMQSSVDELEDFLRKNEDDLEYLVAKCVEDNIVICDTFVKTAGVNGKKITVEQEVLSRRDRLIANLPSNMDFSHVCPSDINLYDNNAIFETMHIEISFLSSTEDGDGYVAGSIGTVELNHTWRINVAAYDFTNYVRACKAFEKINGQIPYKSYVRRV